MFTATSKLINNTNKIPRIFYSRITRIKALFADILFPKFCVGCRIEGDFLCSKCSKDIIPVVSQVCPGCGKLSESGRYCSKCRFDIIKEKIPGKKKLKITKRVKLLEGIIAAAYFGEGTVREMIHNLKYNGVVELARPLAKLMAESLDLSHLSHLSNLSLVPIPLHWRRQAQRGYNQSELLAQSVGEKLGLPVVNLLRKTKNTKRQAELSGKDRRKNLEGVFRVDPSHSGNLSDLTILLVDDVYTTGSTLNECARVLKHAGAKEVWGLTVARG